MQPMPSERDIMGSGSGGRDVCPKCGEMMIVKYRKQMDGWRCVGSVPVCGLCGEELEPAAVDDFTETRDERARSKALELLGDSASGSDRLPELTADDDVRFCRDCQHYWTNPFNSKCLLHKRDVEPMGDCGEFERKHRDQPAL